LVVRGGDGRVGIGTGSPELPLDVNGDVRIGLSTGTILEGNANWSSGDFRLKPFDNYSADVFGWIYYGSGAKAGNIAMIGYGYAPTPNRYFTITDGATGIDRMVVNFLSGNVGIANTNPQFKLDVAGSLNLNSTSTAYMQGHTVIGSNALQDGYGLTIATTTNFLNATGTNLHVTELCIGNDCKTAWPTGGVASWDDLTNKPATSTILNLLDTQSRIAVLNATTTNVGTLKVYTALDFPANSITSAMMTTGWNSLHNATTTYPGFQSQFNTALNATTTWAGFTSNFNTLLNATTTLDLSTFSVGSGDAFTINSSGVATSSNTTTIGSMKCYKSPNQESHTTTCISI
jgi:hypothetical protein